MIKKLAHAQAHREEALSVRQRAKLKRIVKRGNERR